MLKALRKIQKGLCALFLVLLLLAFNAPVIASMIVLCIVLHEFGHALALSLLGRAQDRIRIDPRGLVMPYRGTLSYREEMLVCAAGPLMNLACALSCLFLLPLGSSFFLTLAVLHLLYAFSNLLPLPSNDGEKLLCSALALRFGERVCERVCYVVAFVLRTLFLFTSLFLMLTLNAAYHLFFAFFLSWLPMLGNGLKSDVF